MRQSAAVVCHDKTSLRALETTLDSLGINLDVCSSGQKALEAVMTGRCSTLIVDFDLPGAEEVIRMAALLPPSQKPALLAVASRAWPGTGQAFQSGAGRILYRPIDAEQLKDALKSSHKRASKARRKSARFEMKTLVYLDLESGTVPGVSIDIGEHGLAVQATEPVPMSSNLAFRCVLPGTGVHAARACRCDLGQRSRPRRTFLLQAWAGREKASQALAPSAQCAQGQRR